MVQQCLCAIRDGVAGLPLITDQQRASADEDGNKFEGKVRNEKGHYQSQKQ